MICDQYILWLTSQWHHIFLYIVAIPVHFGPSCNWMYYLQ